MRISFTETHVSNGSSGGRRFRSPIDVPLVADKLNGQYIAQRDRAHQCDRSVLCSVTIHSGRLCGVTLRHHR
jgi:hypothetical protein